MTRRIDLHLWLFNPNLHKKIRFFLPIIFLALAGLACNFPKLRTPAKALRAAEQTPQITQQTFSPLIDGSTSVNHLAGSGDPTGTEVILRWQGTLPGDPVTCHTMDVTADYQASYGPCGDQPSSSAFNPPQWDEIQLRSAPFEMRTPEVNITFRGLGNIGGPAWERAMANWARDAYASLYTGHACSSCSTILNWSFGEQPGGSGSCAYLWATNYGYAYTGVVPCQGGQALIVAQGWLETDEWAQLDAWLVSRSEVHLGESGASYLLGSGSQAMNTDEINQLAAWSLRVYNRLAETRH